MEHEVENFYGCYLLYSTNQQYKGWTYIGFTVDPNRRIKQHNTGKHAGGAWRTSGRGPWDMVLIIHGFPNMISALRFEWAWQNPHKSRRLRHISGKKKSERKYQFCLRVVCSMLNTRPWNRMALTFRWLNQHYIKDFDLDNRPPPHMAVAYGPVKSKKVTKKKEEDDDCIAVEDDNDLMLSQISSQQKPRCSVCHKRLEGGDNLMKCYQKGCQMAAHTLCLAQQFLGGTQELIPLDGDCPRCHQVVLWGDLVRYKQGCYQEDDKSDQEEEDHWANELQSLNVR